MRSQRVFSMVFGGCLVAMFGCLVQEVDVYPNGIRRGANIGGSSAQSSATGGSASVYVAGGTGGTTCFCPDDGNECTQDACVDGACIHSPKAQGSSCATNQVCDDQGNCVECNSNTDCTGKNAYCQNHDCIACDDGKKNGDETDVDCGNNLCGKCNADTCTDKSECASGFCADGVCCIEACDAACYACKPVNMNAGKKPGECNPIDFMSSDGPLCQGTHACTGTGDCKTASGNACTEDNTCVSGQCNSGMCVTAAGGPCFFGGECESGLCDTNTHLCLP